MLIEKVRELVKEADIWGDKWKCNPREKFINGEFYDMAQTLIAVDDAERAEMGHTSRDYMMGYVHAMRKIRKAMESTEVKAK